jgi:hypothetical protein
MKTGFGILWLVTVFGSCLFVAKSSPAAPLLAMDFGRVIPEVISPLQPGFTAMYGSSTQATATATFGTLTVDLAGQGFFTTSQAARVAALDPSIREFYRDYYYNNSTTPGVGVTLAITGVTPNVPYNLTLWSFDANGSTTVPTPTTWNPKSGSNTTGGSATIDNIRNPLPLTLSDKSATIQVTSTTNTLEIFGTTSGPPGNGGTRLNGFIINDGTSDLLAVDFAQQFPATPPSPLQPGFVGGYGTTSQTTYTETIGAYTVNLAGQGFFHSTTAANVDAIDPSVRDFYMDYYYNNSVANGEGIALTIEGVTPNTDYDVKLWSYDADHLGDTPTVWSPFGNTTGTTETILKNRVPRPLDINQDYTKTIRVRSTTTTLEIFGTTTSGTGGTRLNGFELHAVVTAHAGDFDGDGDVDGADFVAWQTNFPKATGATLAEGDADADGDVDGADFVVWQTNFPFTPGPGSAVPEPAAWFVCGLAIPALALVARRKHAAK